MTPIPATLSNERYINTLHYLPTPPPTTNRTTTTSSSFTSSTDHYNIKSEHSSEDSITPKMSTIVADLVRLLQSGSPIPFSLIRCQFSTTILSDQTLLTALASCAVLVRGNFCLASKLIGGMSPSMAQARTFLLFLFQSMGVVHRPRLEHVFATTTETTMSTMVGSGSNSTSTSTTTTTRMNGGSTIPSSMTGTKVTPAVLEFLLHQVGKQSDHHHGGNGGWILKVDDDIGFMEQYPQTVLLHVQYWATLMEDHFQPWLQRYRE
jgi:hypothetical protein